MGTEILPKFVFFTLTEGVKVKLNFVFVASVYFKQRQHFIKAYLAHHSPYDILDTDHNIWVTKVANTEQFC